LFGHVHNYERTCALYNGKCKANPVKDDSGIDTYDNTNYTAPVHAIIGMAGFTLDKFSPIVSPQQPPPKKKPKRVLKMKR